MSTVTRVALGSALTLAVLPRLVAAEEALDAEFLDYLGTLEGETEDWTWFSEDEPKDLEQNAPAVETEEPRS